MPNLDKTGPLGQGPKTGRGVGSCMSRGCFGCCGRGFGFRRFLSSKDQISSLEEQEKILVEELDAIREEKESLVK